ncbi:MAG TPA: acyl-CoA dehydrogenase [Symbiobacteriaceae bacterium]
MFDFVLTETQRAVRTEVRRRRFTAEGLTEPRGGSDFSGATTTAVRKGDYFILNGQKRFVVGTEGADYFLVYARTNPDVPPQEGMRAFLVDRGPGVEVGHIYGLMGSRGGGTGRVVFRNVEVPAENLVGQPPRMPGRSPTMPCRSWAASATPTCSLWNDCSGTPASP